MTDLYFLVEYPIFRDMDSDDVECLGGLCEELNYKKGETVFEEDSPGDAMYIIKSGLLEVVRGRGEQTRHINLLNPGEFFGDMALIDGSPRSAGIVVKEDAVLVRFSREDFRRLKKQFPATGLKVLDVLLKTLSFRVRRSTNRALERERLDPWADMSAVGSAKVKALAVAGQQATMEGMAGSNLWAEAHREDEARARRHAALQVAEAPLQRGRKPRSKARKKKASGGKAAPAKKKSAAKKRKSGKARAKTKHKATSKASPKKPKSGKRR
jgi:CRP-like cAMP-binding protein